MAAAVLVIVVIIFVTLFSVQNAMPVTISFLAWRFDASLAVIALLFFLGGLITGAGVLFWAQMRRKARKKRAEAEKKQAGGEPSHSADRFEQE